MDFAFTKGQRLIVELSNNDMFEGDYQSGTENRIDMVNVVESPKGTKIKANVFSYYRTEVVSVHVLQDTENSKEENGIEADVQYERPSNAIVITRTEYERLEEMTKSYSYMATRDKRYLQAVNHLSSCETVGLVAIGSELGRLNIINLLVLCSWDQVYIFDVRSFRHKVFEPELKEILESVSIKKVVHDARPLTDCLWHCHNITLKNVFDTSIADVMLLADQTGSAPKQSRSLSECLTHYFNFPISLLEETNKLQLVEWEKRPLKENLPILASLRVVYLIILKYKQEELMMKNFYTVVESYMENFKSTDRFTVRTNISSRDIPEEILDLINTSKKCVH